MHRTSWPFARSNSRHPHETEAHIHLKRTGEIARVFTKHGLDWLSFSDSPWRFVALPKRLFKSHPERTQPERVRLALEELGTTYIKLGQAISTRTDLLPPEYVHELSKLQDSVKPTSYQAIRQVVTEDLGCPPEAIFCEIDPKPDAAASIAQVHRATLPDGAPVVLKVQRPGTEHQVTEDLEVMRELAAFLDSNTLFGKTYDIEGWLEEFRFSIRNELDFRREGHNADIIRENFRDDPEVRIPRICWELTSKRVITMERIDGVKITDWVRANPDSRERRRLAALCARVVLTEIFRDGFFHADPHPGNFFVLPDGTIAIIDMGMVGRLDFHDRASLVRVMRAVLYEDPEYLADELRVLGSAKGRVPRQALVVDLQRVLLTYLEGPPDALRLAPMLNDVLGIAARRGLQLPSNLLFLAKTLAMCEGLGTMLDPDFNLKQFASDYLKEHASEMKPPEPVSERLRRDAADLAELGMEWPQKARSLLAQFERGELTFVGRVENFDKMAEHLHAAANRIAMAALMSALIVGVSFVVSRSELPNSLHTLLNVMFAIVIIGGVSLLVAMWRSKRL